MSYTHTDYNNTLEPFFYVQLMGLLFVIVQTCVKENYKLDI